MFITLIVKAPNQQIEDQTIKCELSWTINKLKQHLSEVYPSNPPKHEQKLIYSGQLLNDSFVLKDVLRLHDGQETHTVHLVCTTGYNTAKNQTLITLPQEPEMQHTSTSNLSMNPLNNNEDQRVPIQNNLQWFHVLPYEPHQYAVHMAWIQQAYINYFTQLAMNSANGQFQIRQGHANILQPEADNHIDVPAPEAAAPAPQQPVLPQRDVDNNAERDWLDFFYIFSRVLVLFSVVYFYSSPLRFVFVLFLGFGLYLYQIGFFRNINYNNNNNNVPVEIAAQEVHSPSRLMVIWTFFTTFFASLIPDTPNPI